MTPTRARILDAAELLLRTIGLARATTKEIARAAGCSEAALYKHFRNKEDIFVRVLEERLPKLGPLLAELTEHPGERDMTENLTEIARRAAEFYASSVPIIAALYAEPTLLKRHNEGLREINTGPRRPLDALAGRLRADADCRQRRGAPARCLLPARVPAQHGRERAPARRVRRRPRPHGAARHRLTARARGDPPPGRAPPRAPRAATPSPTKRRSPRSTCRAPAPARPSRGPTAGPARPAPRR